MTVIWVVDDDEDVAAHLRLTLRRAGAEVEVRGLADGNALRAALAGADTDPAVVLLDQVLPGERGSALVPEVKRIHPQAEIRLITAAPDEISEEDRAVGVIAKPPAASEILEILASVGDERP